MTMSAKELWSSVAAWQAHETAPIAVTPEACSALRARLGWSRWVLASRAGLSERTVMLFEAGMRSPRPGTVIALRRAFYEAAVQAVAHERGRPKCSEPADER